MSTSTSQLPVRRTPHVAAHENLGPSLAGEPSIRSRAATTDAAMFTVGTYVAQGLLFAAGLVQKAILGPVAVGYWSLMQSFWTFFSIAPLGAQHGATRQVPIHRGRGDFEAAGSAAGTAASFSFCAISGVGAVVAIVAILFGGGWAPELRFGLVLLGVTAPLRYMTDVHEVILQAVKRFDVASMAVIARGVLALTVQTLAVYLFGFYGLFLGLVAIQVGVFALWLRLGAISRRQPAFRWGIDRARLREVIRFGAPLMVWSQIWLLFVAVDSLIVAGALDVKRLGYYAVAVSMTHYVLYLPRSIGAVLFPRMTEDFARTGEIESIRHYATDVQGVLAYTLIPASIGAGFFLVPVLIRQALPAFDPAIPVIQIMVAASFFMALMNMPIKVLLAAGYRWSLTGILLTCLALNVVLNYGALVPLDLGIEGAAGATAISYLVTFLMTSGYSLSRWLDPWSVLLHVGEILLVFAYVYGGLRLVEWLIGAPDAGLAVDAALACAKLAAFLVLMTPLFVLAERRLGAISRMRVVLARGGIKLRRSRG